MVKKRSTKKKSTKRIKKILPDRTSKKITSKENDQLAWLFLIIILVFSAFLGFYFYNEGSNVFEFAGADWIIEEYANFTAYHGRFLALDGSNYHYNIWLRNDPRKNNVPTEGIFNTFKYNAIVSFDKTIGECRGELTRAVLDLGQFLNGGVGTKNLETATTDLEVSQLNNVSHVDCSLNIYDTIIILEEGEASVIKDSQNPFCYTIKVQDCGDILGIEKFMIKTIDDFGDN
jgi:hypothetical protein